MPRTKTFRPAPCHPDRMYWAKDKCKPCYQAISVKAWVLKNPEKRKAIANRYANKPDAKLKFRERSLWQDHKITVAQYDMLAAEQNHKCAICETDTPGGRGVWHIDHDHKCCPGSRSCGKCTRALLCMNCNHGLGNFRDNLKTLLQAFRYLEKYEIRTVAA